MKQIFAIYKRASETGFLTEDEAFDEACEVSYVLSMFTRKMEKLINESEEATPEEIEESEKWVHKMAEKRRLDKRRFNLEK